jgi:type II secretory pathway component PulC
VTSTVLRLAVIALLVYAGVTLWYSRVEERLHGQQPVVEQKERVATSVQEERPPVVAEDDYRIILTRNIFKAALEASDQAGESSRSDLDDLAETKLRLVLLGTVTGGKDDARAIIRDETTKLEDLYQAGSEVQGAVISRISRGKVVLQLNGREEILTIKDPENENQGQVGAPRMESKAAGKAPSPPGREVENKVPEAQPRRRISFRNTAPAAPGAENPANPSLEEGPAEMAEKQPLPDDEAPLPDARMEKGAEQQGQ